MASLYVLPHFVHLLLYMLAWLSVWLLAAACRERLRSLCLREAPPRGESSCVSIRMGWGSLPVASGLTGAVSYPTVDVFDYSGFCLWRGKLGAIEVTGQTERHVLSNARAPELVGLRATVKAILVMTPGVRYNPWRERLLRLGDGQLVEAQLAVSDCHAS
jgi:hypothetical protein